MTFKKNEFTLLDLYEIKCFGSKDFVEGQTVISIEMTSELYILTIPKVPTFVLSQLPERERDVGKVWTKPWCL